MPVGIHRGAAVAAWRLVPARSTGMSIVIRNLAAKWGPALGRRAASCLRPPVFLVGFNNSGKSTLVEGLAQQPKLALFPGEGNDLIWFRGFYPWWKSDLELAPLWYSPEAFTRAVVDSRSDGFLEARAQLGAYQALRARGETLVNDSGMLAALLPEIIPAFPDARIIHLVRDGRVTSFLAAQKTMSLIAQHVERYRRSGCPVDAPGVLAAQAKYWCWTVERVRKAEARLPDGSLLQVRYEDWCDDPVGTLRSVARFVDADSHFRIPTWKVPIRNRNVDVLCSMSEADLACIQSIQDHHLRHLGYRAHAKALEQSSAVK
jgi:hypothetical protein